MYLFIHIHYLVITDKKEIAILNNEYKLLKADYIDIHEQDEVKNKINVIHNYVHYIHYQCVQIIYNAFLLVYYSY